MMPFAALSFVSALLLFIVQPLMARAVLPWFGGAASVWTTSLLFFQTMLFLGYAYAHLGRRLGVRRQAILHIGLVGLSLLLLPITPAEAWRPVDAGGPTLRLLGLLTASIGAPYLLLAGTTPLLHDWFGRSAPLRSPYRLYAVSNAGSLLALLAYPTVVEPFVAVHAQGIRWSWAYAVFGVGLGWLAWYSVSKQRSGTPPSAAASSPATTPPTLGDLAFWTALAACGTGLLMAITNVITMDVASVPLLWVLPLALYLTTFIVAFGGGYRRGTWGALLVLGLGATVLLWAGGFALPVAVQILLGCGVLVAGCMVCHGELALTAPQADHLTSFYLAMAGGGALGGLSVAIIAPAVLSDFYEFPGFVLLTYAILLVAMRRDPRSILRSRRASATMTALAGVGLLAATGIVVPTLRAMSGTLATARNFYGVLRVQDRPAGILSEMRVLRHGRIFHGAQYLDPERAALPTAYFTAGSGAAQTIRTHPRSTSRNPIKVGVIGLGVGTLAAWGRPGDSYRFYEINPAAERLAREYFSFLDDQALSTDGPGAVSARITIEVVLGDGRIMLEREVERPGLGPQFDVLVIDAFSGDAVPVHLLTLEALELYRRALAPGGVIVIQITNRHLDLERVVRGLAEASGLQALRLDQTPAEGSGSIRNSWMWLAPQGVPAPTGVEIALPSGAPPVLWTDDFSNLIRVLR